MKRWTDENFAMVIQQSHLASYRASPTSLIYFQDGLPTRHISGGLVLQENEVIGLTMTPAWEESKTLERSCATCKRHSLEKHETRTMMEYEGNRQLLTGHLVPQNLASISLGRSR